MAVAIAVLSRTKNDNEPKGVDCHRRIAIVDTHSARGDASALKSN